MARTNRINTAPSKGTKDLLNAQIKKLKKQLTDKLKQYEKTNGEIYPLLLVDGEVKVEEVPTYDFINPEHYVQDDGRQTWERMVDKWGEKETALWCEMTAFKYQDRIGRKPGEDIEREQNKIKWYEEKADELKAIAKKKKFW